MGQHEIDPDEWLKTMAWNNRFYRAVGRLESYENLRCGNGTEMGSGVCSAVVVYTRQQKLIAAIFC